MAKIRNIIREARGTMSQAEFARRLGKSQGLISKYERGSVSPPSTTLEKCMKILEDKNKDEVSSAFLAMRIKKELNDPQFAYARKTIAALLDSLPPASGRM